MNILNVLQFFINFAKFFYFSQISCKFVRPFAYILNYINLLALSVNIEILVYIP